MTMPMISCSGCKAVYVSNSRAVHPLRHLQASPECWLEFSLLMNMFYRAGSGLFEFRQWVVDAYTLQHAKLDSPAGVQAAALSLGTLQMSLIAPSAVGEGPALHGRMADSKLLPTLIAPPTLKMPERLTVKDLAGLADEREIKNLAHEWAKVARERWADSLPAVDAWLKQNDYFMRRART